MDEDLDALHSVNNDKPKSMLKRGLLLFLATVVRNWGGVKGSENTDLRLRTRCLSARDALAHPAALGD